MILDGPDSWSSHATTTAIRRVLFISWKSPPLRFVKVKFDSSVRDARMASDVIQDSDSRLLVIGALGFSSIQSSLELPMHALFVLNRSFVHTGSSSRETLLSSSVRSRMR